jgi:hypothetical protein
MSRALGIAVGVWCAVALASSPALAFRPSVTWVCAKVVDKANARGTSSLKVDATTSAWDVTGKVVVDGAAERVWLQAPGKLRRELDAAGGTTVEVRVDGRLVVKAPGKPDSNTRPGTEVLAELMTAAKDQDPGVTAQRLITTIKALGINPEVVSYARFDGRVAYLVGSKPWETDKPQIWFDKDLMVPLRLVTFVKDGGSSIRLDVRYLGWGSAVGGAWYPQAVEVWRGETLLRRSVTEALERNAAIDAQLFELR